MSKCNIKKIIIKIVLIILCIQALTVPIVNASDSTIDEWFDASDNFIQQGKEGSSQMGKDGTSIIDYDGLNKLSKNLGQILLTFGIAVSVIIGAVLGIQIMWGSIEQQVKAKEMLMPYAIGCIVVFGAFAIWRLAVLIFSQL